MERQKKQRNSDQNNNTIKKQDNPILASSFMVRVIKRQQQVTDVQTSQILFRKYGSRLQKHLTEGDKIFIITYFITLKYRRMQNFKWKGDGYMFNK